MRISSVLRKERPFRPFSPRRDLPGWALIKNWKKNILSALPACTVRSQQFANSKRSSQVELCGLFLILCHLLPPRVLQGLERLTQELATITSIKQMGKLRAAASVGTY